MNFICIGGDKRHAYMKDMLMQAGLSEKTYKSWEHRPFSEDDVLILPVPSFGKDGMIKGMEEVNLSAQRLLTGGTVPGLIIGGMFPKDFIDGCKNASVKAIDITDRDDYAILNAIPTAEAAIMIAMEELTVCLWGLKILVTGYGRVSQVLCDRLTSLGGKVTVAARKNSDRAYAVTRGAESADIRDLDDIHPEKYRLIYNTVPSTVIDRDFISRVRSDVLIIDLASMPGGCDTEALEERGIKWIHALSLPGRNAPETAGNVLAETVLKIIREEGKI